MNIIRTFIAVELSDGIKREIGRVISELKRSGENIKWVKPGNMHITLKFLGNVKEEKIPQINNKLIAVSKEFGAFDINIHETGVFPGWRNPRVLWAGIDSGKERLKSLSERIEAGMMDIGFEKEKREFKAHLTIGRVKHIKNKKKFEQIVSSTRFTKVFMRISEICVFKSTLTPLGAVYEKLFYVMLNA
jgi:2'-5' RNA ligase